MSFTARFANYNDVEECELVARDSIGGTGYLTDAWHYYDISKGETVCICDGNKIIGIGRMSILFDGSGWLEALRVMKAYQGQGAGKMIYNEWLKLAEQYKCPSMAMFTGTSNVVSAGLAEKYGLKLSGTHAAYVLKNLEGGNAYGFKHVNWKRSCELLMPLKEEYNDYITFNRTFYHINEANIKGFSAEGKVFEDAESGSFIAIGARFQHQATMHIGRMGGDLDRCIDFAISYAKANGNTTVTCTPCLDNPKLEAKLAERGFELGGKLITKEVVF